jgi:hypothetical protein
LYLVTAKEFDEVRQAWLIDPNDPRNIGRLKTRRSLAKQRRMRVIRIPDHLLPLAKQLMAEYPSGPIFRRESGQPWTKVRIATRFGRTRAAINKAAKKEVIRKGVTLYSARHAFCTRWILAKKDTWVLATLLNTSVRMLTQTYAHLFDKDKVMLEALNDFHEQERQDRGTGQSPNTAASAPATVSAVA